MNEYDLLDAIGDINDKYIENAGAEEELGDKASKEIRGIQIRERRKKAILLAVSLVGIVLIAIIVGMVTKNNLVSKNRDEHEDNPAVDGTGDELPIEDIELYERYQFLRFNDELYLSSKEECVNIGDYLGTFWIASDIEGDNTDTKEVPVYKIINMDISLAVAVFYEEEQSYHTYYNSVIR